MLGMTTTSDPGTTGIKDIADALGGGLRENSLILLEGEPKTGKSVLSQHIAFGVMSSRGSAVTYFTTDYTPEALIDQMDSMSLETRHRTNAQTYSQSDSVVDVAFQAGCRRLPLGIHDASQPGG
jgi:archaellum biogenesis ATPase FlaH